MFTRIDLANFERAEYFKHFTENVPCVYNITANIDVTVLLKRVKEVKAKLYPALIFMLTKIVNRNAEFRLGYDEENRLGFYDVCHPSYTIPNALTDGFSGIWDFAKDNFSEFFKCYNKSVDEFSKAVVYAPKKNQPYNTFYVSCTPEIAFTSLSLNLFKGENCLTPMLTIGKYFENSGKILIPLAACLHHAACDGSHAAKLFKQMQSLANDADNWLSI